MFKPIYDTKNDILIVQRNLISIVAFILLVINLLLSISLIKKDTNTIIVPFGINDKVIVSSKKPQNNYLEAFSRDIINTMLNLNPNNVDYMEKTILAYADGSSYGSLKKHLELLKKNIVSKKFSTVFYPISIQADNTTMKVIVDGTLYVYFGQKQVSSEKKRYEITYRYESGRLSIIGFSEIIEEDNSNNNR